MSNQDKVKTDFNTKVKLTSKTGYDNNVYDNSDKTGYSKYIQDEEDDIQLEEEIPLRPSKRKDPQREILEEEHGAGTHEDTLYKRTNERTIASRESDYQKRKRLRETSPERYDPLKDFDREPDANARNYSQIMLERIKENERQEILRKQVADKKIVAGAGVKRQKLDENLSVTTKLTDWDKLSSEKVSGDADMTATPRRKRWDLTPNEATPRGKHYYKLIAYIYEPFRTFVNI
jgi:splicing factor 3B subunit 1